MGEAGSGVRVEVVRACVCVCVCVCVLAVAKPQGRCFSSKPEGKDDEPTSQFAGQKIKANHPSNCGYQISNMCVCVRVRACVL